MSINLKLAEKTARLILTDRWYNPCDEYASAQSPFSFELSKAELGEGYCELQLDFDTEKAIATAKINGKCLATIDAKMQIPTGISYLVMQCATEDESEGFYVKSLAMQSL